MPDAEDLVFAAARGDLATCKHLLDRGAPVNGSSRSLHPLLRAAAGGHVEVCRYLLERGANAHGRYGAYGQTLLTLAAESEQRQLELCELFLMHGYDPRESRGLDAATPLHSAARSQNLDVIELLLAKGADPCARDAAGATPLHDLVTFGDLVPAAQRLIEAGADPQALTESSTSGVPRLTPFQMAIRAGRSKLANFFFEQYGEDLDQVASSGQTLLELVEGSKNSLAVFLSLVAQRKIRDAVLDSDTGLTSPRRSVVGPAL